MMKWLCYLFFFIISLSFVSATCDGATYSFTCGQNVNESCTMNGGSTTTTTCFNITTDNVILDCNAQTINFSTSATGYGIVSKNRNNVTITNCNIIQKSWTYSNRNIYFSNVTNSSIINNNITILGHVSNGIYTEVYSKNNIISNNIVNGGAAGSHGIFLFYTNNTYLSNNSVIQPGLYAGGYGIYLYVASNNTLVNNTVSAPKAPDYLIQGGNNSIDTSNLAGTLPLLYRYGLNNTAVENQDWSNTYGEVICSGCMNTTYNNMTFAYDGLVFATSTFSTIKNCSFNASTGSGVHMVLGSNDNIVADTDINIAPSVSTDLAGVFLSTSYRVNVTNNNIIAIRAYGIFINIGGARSYINLDRNRINVTSGTGIGTNYGLGFNATDNVIIGNNSGGVYVVGHPLYFVPNFLYRNNITTNSYCIVLSNTYYNYFEDNILNCDNYGISITGTGGNNSIYKGGIINTHNASIIISGTLQNNNTFVDMILNSSDKQDILLNSSSYIYAIFTNVTYNDSKTSILGNTTAFFKWHLDLAVNYSDGNLVPGVSVWGWHSNGSNVFMASTGGELPNSATEVNPYFANMSGNILLMHLNEQPAINKTVISDTSGSGDNGILQTYTDSNQKNMTGILNTSAISFDGVDDWINVSNMNLSGLNQISYEAWIKPNNLAGSHGILSKNGSFVTGAGEFVLYTSTAGIRAYIKTTGTACSNAAAGTLLTGNTYYIAGVYNGTTNKLYINGALTSTFACNGSIIDSSSTPFGVGMWKGYMFNGTVDEVAIYNRVLTVDEIFNHYDAGRTSRTGILGTSRFDLTEYTQNASGKNYALNYTINATKDSTTSSQQANLTTNMFLYFEFLADSCTPPASGDWNIIDDCILSSPIEMNGNVYIGNNGSLTLNSIITFLGLNRIIAINRGSEIYINSGGKID